MKGALHRVIFAALLAAPGWVRAERLTMQFNNNRVKLLVTRSTADERKVIKVEIYAPEKQGYSIFSAENPTRIVIDFKKARVTRSRALDIKDSEVIKSVRLGVHPDKLRAVVELKTKSMPAYTWSEQGDWFTVLIPESGAAAADQPAGEPHEETPVEQDLEASANLWNKAAHDLKNDGGGEDQFYEHLEVRPEVKWTYDRSLYFVAGADADFYYWENTEEAQGEVRPYNVYLNESGENYNIRLGNQIVTWGKSDEVSPLDNLNPEDLRDGIVRRRGERKIPIPMANVELREDVFALQGVYIPAYKRSRIYYFEDDWALAPGSPSSLVNEDSRNGAFDAGEFGFRFSGKISSFDYALSYLSTISDLPSVDSVNFPVPPPAGAGPLPQNISQLFGLAAQSGATVNVEYNRREVLGAEFETVLGDFGLRGDFAYTDKEDYFTSNLEARQSSTYRYVIGLDYSSPDDLYVNIQFGQSYISGYSDDYLFNDRVTNSIYEEIWQEFWDNNIRLGVRGFYEFARKGNYINPYCLLTYWEDYQFELGLDLVDGDGDSTIGVYRDNDQGYLLAKAFF